MRSFDGSGWRWTGTLDAERLRAIGHYLGAVARGLVSLTRAAVTADFWCRFLESGVLTWWRLRVIEDVSGGAVTAIAEYRREDVLGPWLSGLTIRVCVIAGYGLLFVCSGRGNPCVFWGYAGISVHAVVVFDLGGVLIAGVAGRACRVVGRRRGSGHGVDADGRLRWRCVAGVLGGVPAVFEVSQEPAFEFGGDVAVGLDDAVVQVVAQAAGLGDFRDVVGDQPGFVAVAQPVEGQAGLDRVGACGRVDEGEVAIHGGRRTRRMNVERHSHVPLGVVNTYS